ncbi:MAG: NAD-dependent epimerase/dehydratase family protein [Myxococcaceae bacterium]
MSRPSGDKKGLRVAVTGATGDLGQLLLPLLEADERVERVIAIDLAKPRAHGPKVEFRRVNLAQAGGEIDLRDALLEAGADTLYHLAFLYGRVHNAAFAHELEVIGSMHTLSAVAQAGVKRLVIPSLTALYGARPQHPALLREDAPLHGCKGSRFVNDKVEVEQQFAAFGQKHPETRVIILRFAPIIGPSVDNPITRLLRTRLVPTLMGFDPLWQVVHEDDAAAALHLALFADVSGPYNVVGHGVISLSALVRWSGGAALPMPAPVARAAIRALEAAGVASVPSSLLDFIHYSWVADGKRAQEELGFFPRYASKDAAASMRGG